jgi:uncharacterized repeat protein (TIGR02543 family)
MRKLLFMVGLLTFFLSACGGPLEVEVTFETNGGSTISSMIFNEENTFTLPNDPTKEGFSFDGWYLDETFDTPFSVEGVLALEPESTITLYASWMINAYTITFDSNGGSAVSAITQNYDTTVTIPSAPTKEGYTFGGWSETVPTTMPAENTTLTATWTINAYTITFDSNGGSAVSAITQNYDTTVTIPSAPTKEGYTFGGWSETVPTTMPAENQTLTAIWTINAYTITFDSNGGSAVSAITQNYDTTVTIPSAPTKEGYTFGGWSETVPTTMPAENTTLTATWTINAYTITFDSNGGSAVSAITQDYDTTVTIPSAPTKEGYTFGGWSETFPTTMPAENQTLTAIWTINAYTITFDSNGGSAVSAITQNYDTTVTIPSAPTKEGYTFGGWSETVPTTMPAENTTLTATWTINAYTITFDSNGGSAVSAITQDYDTTVTIPSAPTKEGYTFGGWSETFPTTMPAENQTLTAIWTINAYTITFDSNGGSAVSAITQNYDTTVTIPSAPTKEGYTFGGWSETVPTTMPAKNTTLTATWKVDLSVASLPFLSKHIQVNQSFELPQSLSIDVINESHLIEMIWEIDTFSSSEEGYFTILGSTEDFQDFIEYHFHVSIIDEDKNIISGYVFGETKQDIRVVLSNNTNVWITSTDENGFFKFLNVENGLYVIRVDQEGVFGGEPIEINLNSVSSPQAARRNATPQSRIEHVSFFLEEITEDGYYYEWFFTGDVFGYEHRLLRLNH